MLAPPRQASLVAGTNIVVATYYQQSNDADWRRSELLCERGGCLLVVQKPEPINDLVEAMVEAWRPIATVPSTPGEEAGWRGILELHEAVGALRPVPSDHVGHNLAVEPHFDPETITDGCARIV